MTDIVLDCSVTMAWFFEDEAMPAFYAIQDRVVQKGAFVPSLWPYEVGNVFRQAEKRGRLTAEQITYHLGILNDFPITMDEFSSGLALRKSFSLARDHGLTLYDAAYLELALRRALPLATKDNDLRKAAQKLGVSLLPEAV